MSLRLWNVDFYIVTWKSHIVRTYWDNLSFLGVLCSIGRKFLIWSLWGVHPVLWDLIFWLCCFVPFSVTLNRAYVGFLYLWFHNCLRDMSLCCGSTSYITSSLNYFILGDRSFGFYAHCGYICWRYSPVGSSVVRLYACDSWS